MDISNDPEIERLGANATALFALKFWNKIAEAARKDGKLLDPLWGDFAERFGDEEPSQDGDAVVPDCHYTKHVVLTDSSKQDHRLYSRFRSNFGGLMVQKIPVVAPRSRSGGDANDDDDEQINFGPNRHTSVLGGEKWQTLLMAAEGQIPDYNFMTLLRSDAMDMFWMNELDVSDGLLVVPRAQFLYIELARIKEGRYGSDFRKALQLFDVLTQVDTLRDALSDIQGETQNDRLFESAVDGLSLLQTQWPNPTNNVLKQSGIIKLLKRGMAQSFSPEIAAKSTDLLHFWQDLKQLAKIPNSLGVKEGAPAASTAAIRRAGRSLIQQGATAGNADADMAGGDDIIPTYTLDEVKVSQNCDKTTSMHLFKTTGVMLFDDLLSEAQLKECQQQAHAALASLKTEQLEPRGLQVDGMEEFDFAEVRQRPGHRVDNRYKILDDPKSPIGALAADLVKSLPTYWKDEGFEVCYGGVVHSFPRENEDDALPPAQIWHRDGPSILTHDHDTHCFNVFIPLVDVTTANGTTELIPGTHREKPFEELATQVIPLAQRDALAQHAKAVRADMKAGSVLVFDIRVLHRGLSNASMQDRPMLYFTCSKDWFHEKHMFSNESLRASPELMAHQRLLQHTYRLIASDSTTPESSLPQSIELDYTKNVEYGHPHFTTRFDLLLLEDLKSNDTETKLAALQNLAAVLAFAQLDSSAKMTTCKAFVECLKDPATIQRKRDALAEAQNARRQAYAGINEDFASISEDMSDVSTLYKLTAQIVLDAIPALQFSKDRDGLCVVLAMLKAYARSHEMSGSNETATSWQDLEEAFTSWWHGGYDRFALRQPDGTFQGIDHAATPPSCPNLLVVFSSLGSGIAKPEWIGSLRSIAKQYENTLDIVHVMDPAFSWYCQDPKCEWQGGEFYRSELRKIAMPYQRVMFLGDSMGAAAALRFADVIEDGSILAFTPQVDISEYSAIRRADMDGTVRTAFRDALIMSVQQSRASPITVHYGKDCEEDVGHVKLLPSNVNLVQHDFDDHVLSLHLRDLGTLTQMVEDAICKFVDS